MDYLLQHKERRNKDQTEKVHFINIPNDLKQILSFYNFSSSVTGALYESDPGCSQVL